MSQTSRNFLPTKLRHYALPLLASSTIGDRQAGELLLCAATAFDDLIAENHSLRIALRDIKNCATSALPEEPTDV